MRKSEIDPFRQYSRASMSQVPHDPYIHRRHSQSTLQPIFEGYEMSAEYNTIMSLSSAMDSITTTSAATQANIPTAEDLMEDRESNSTAYVANDYNSIEPFMRRRDGSYPSETKCLLCRSRPITTIFFPCQHKCICNLCLRSYSIGGHGVSDTIVRTTCPLCLTKIQLLLPHNGREEELYWHWITKAEQVLPMLYPDNGAIRPRSGSAWNVNAPSPPRSRRASAPESPRATQIQRLRSRHPEDKTIRDHDKRTASDGVLIRARATPRAELSYPSSVCTLL